MRATPTPTAAVPSPTRTRRWPGLGVLLGGGLAAFGGAVLVAALLAALPLGAAGAWLLRGPTGAIAPPAVALSGSAAALDATNVRQQLLIGSQPGQPAVLATPIDYQFDVFHNVGQQVLIGSTPRPLVTLGSLPSADGGPAGHPVAATE